MKLAVCEIPSGMVPRDEVWRQFAREVQRLHPGILLLNEMPFGAWLAASGIKDDQYLRDSQRLHADAILVVQLLFCGVDRGFEIGAGVDQRRAAVGDEVDVRAANRKRGFQTKVVDLIVYFFEPARCHHPVPNP